ncbi:MAG: ABC transporter ATP-binding protein [Fibrobacteria bacterium]|nr:ABC transporter ATP-binding protein [Fibrobacteria bacterium]
MSKQEIRQKIDQIIDFSGVEKYIDTPIKRYSSGMHVRLAFSVAAHLEPEILIVDEVLAVGDVEFQKKCLGKMKDVSQKGRTILFVSHNMLAVKSLCTRAILLESGTLTYSERPTRVIEKYMEKFSGYTKITLSDRVDRKGNGLIRFQEAFLLNKKNELITECMTGEHLRLVLKYKTHDRLPAKNVNVAIAINDNSGQQLTDLGTTYIQDPFSSVEGEGYFLCSLPNLCLVSGKYFFNTFCSVSGQTADLIVNAGAFIVHPGDFYHTGRNADNLQSIFLMQYAWEQQQELDIPLTLDTK